MAQRFERLRSVVVQVGDDSTGFIGTGFFIQDGERCTLLTAKHVLNPSNRPPLDRDNLKVRMIYPPDGDLLASFPVSVFYEDPQLDLAFLRVKESCGIGRDLQIQPLRIRQAPPSIADDGTPVTIVGYPAVGSGTDQVTGELFPQSIFAVPVVRRGHVASTEITSTPSFGQTMFLDLIAVSGFSGGPVILNATGEVIGVVFGRVTTDQGFGSNWATPVTREIYETAIGESR